LQFHEDEYEETEWQLIGKILAAWKRPDDINNSEWRRLRQKATRYYLYGGLIFRKVKPDKTPQRVIGKIQERQKVLRAYHDDHWAGHKSLFSTYNKIATFYWWPGMYIDTKYYVETCLSCQARSVVRYYEPLHPQSPIIIKRRWYIDAVKMPKGIDGVSNIIIAREALSNWPEAAATRDLKTLTWIKFIEREVICRHGSVCEIISDGGELDNDTTRDKCRLWGVKLSITTPYHPEGNAAVERGNRPLKESLIKASKDKQRMWPKKLVYALWAERITISRTTRYSAYELMYGQQPQYPTNASILTWAAFEIDEEDIEDAELIDYRIKALEHHEATLSKAAARIKAERQKNIEYWERTHRQRPDSAAIHENDLVLLKNSALEKQWSRKFEDKWLGPYRVKKVFREQGVYELAELNGARFRKRIAGARLKIFRIRRDGKYIWGEQILKMEQELENGKAIHEDQIRDDSEEETEHNSDNEHGDNEESEHNL
jgi:hypothetical protein